LPAASQALPGRREPADPAGSVFSCISLSLTHLKTANTYAPAEDLREVNVAHS
jgi:hypothetical protein